MDNVTLWVCVDCLYCVHGIAEENPDTLRHVGLFDQSVARISGDNLGAQVHLIPSADVHECDGVDGYPAEDCDCETVDFSWNRCELCLSNLGGSRHAVTLELSAPEWAAAPEHVHTGFEAGAI